MTVRVCNKGSASPLGISGWRHDCTRIITQCRERSIDGGNSKADAGAKSGCAIGRKWIKLEHTTRKLGCEMLRPAVVPMLGEL